VYKATDIANPGMFSTWMSDLGMCWGSSTDVLYLVVGRSWHLGHR
jgi:hypothetical protein